MQWQERVHDLRQAVYNTVLLVHRPQKTKQAIIS